MSPSLSKETVSNKKSISPTSIKKHRKRTIPLSPKKQRKHSTSAEINRIKKVPQSIIIDDLTTHETKKKDTSTDYRWLELGPSGQRLSVKESEKVKVAIEIIFKLKYYSLYSTSSGEVKIEIVKKSAAI